MQFLDTLNPEQREAVLHVRGPLLILAGAGSGKTRVITSRIAHLVGDGHARPDEVLAVVLGSPGSLRDPAASVLDTYRRLFAAAHPSAVRLNSSALDNV